MTTFICKFLVAFCNIGWSRFGASTLCLAWLATAINVPAAPAIHIPSPKERAQGDDLYQQAFSAYQAGDYAQAQRLIEKADQLKPDQPDGWNLRGMVFLKQNAFNKAEAAFTRAVALDPKLWAAQFNLAETPFQGKDYARARLRFESLLGQTDRYKEAKQWELVQFKAFMCCVLMGDHAGAAKKMAKIPSNGSATPAYLYAQAALAYSRKDLAGARKPLVAARTTYSPVLNDVFTNSLVVAGWESPLPPPVLTGGSIASAPSSRGSGFGDNHTPIVIDPRMEAAVADPLPSDPDARIAPPKAVPPSPRPSRKSQDTLPSPSMAPTPAPKADLDQRDLLLE